MYKVKIRKVINLAIGIIAPLAWLYLAFRGKGSFMNSGFRTLKYFTIQSNLFSAFTSWLWIVKGDNHKNGLLKYISTISVTITLFVVLTFLGPIFGYGLMFRGASFWLHLIIPVLAIIDFVFFDEESYTKKERLYTLIPLVIYGTFYLGNILINGVGVRPNSNDWYGFARWGIPIGFVLYVVLILFNYGLSSVLYILKRKQ